MFNRAESDANVLLSFKRVLRALQPQHYVYTAKRAATKASRPGNPNPCLYCAYFDSSLNLKQAGPGYARPESISMSKRAHRTLLLCLQNRKIISCVLSHV